MKKIKSLGVTLRRLREKAFRRSGFQRRGPDWDSLPRLLTLSQTADILRVHSNTLRLWDQSGRLRAVRIGSRRDRRYEKSAIKNLWAVQPQPEPIRLRLVGRWGMAVVGLVAILGLGWSSGTFVLADDIPPTSVVYESERCFGWAHSQSAASLDVSAGAPLSAFTARTAARGSSSGTAVASDLENDGIVSGGLDGAADPITCLQYKSGGRPERAEFRTARLKIHLVTKTGLNNGDVVVVEASLDGQTWETVEAFPAAAPPAGYTEYPLPLIRNFDQLAGLQVRLRLETDFPEPPTEVWLDGTAVVVGVQPPAQVDAGAVKRQQKRLDPLVAFSQSTYRATEQPVISVPKIKTKRFLFFKTGQERWRLRTVVLTDAEGKNIQVPFRAADAVRGSDVFSDLRLDTHGLHPGKYRVSVTMAADDGTLVTVQEELLWGVVALNVTRAIARPGDEQLVTMGVLDDGGHTICDADLRLVVIDPNGRRQTLSTEAGSVQTNPECVDKGVTNDPDYSAAIAVDAPGIYQLRLEARTDFGERVLDDNFTVEESTPFDVHRVQYPTRIYPPAPYPVRIAVTPSQDYFGMVREHVPSDFEITETFPEATVRIDPENADQRIIEWAADWKKGETYFLGYTFDAPDISPALFLTGPLTIGGGFATAPDFQEPRQWQIASDAVTANGNIYYGDTTNAGKLKMTPFTSASTYGTEVNINLGPTVNIMHVAAKTAPTREEKMIGFVSGNPTTNGRLDIVTGTTGFEAAGDYTLRWTATSVSGTQDCDNAPTLGTCTQPFDLGYEALSGRGLVVYAGDSDANSTTDTDVIYYAFWDGSAWSPDTTPNTPSATNQLNLPGTGGTPKWVRVVPAGDNLADERSNRAMILVADSDNDLYAYYWDGSNFDSGTEVYTTLGNCDRARCFDGNWQGNNNFILSYTNSGVNEVRYQKYTVGSGWGGDTQAYTTAAAPAYIISAADPTSSRILSGNMTSTNDTRSAVWRGDDATDGWTVCASGSCPDTATEGAGGPQFGLAFERFNGEALHVYNDAANGTAQGNKTIEYTPSATWSTSSTTGISPTDDQQSTKIIPSPSSDDIMIIAADVDCDVDAVLWDGSAPNTPGSNFELLLSSSNGSCANAVPIQGMATTGGYDFAWNIYSPWGLNWRWTGDTSNANPGSWLANENVAASAVADATTVRLRYGFVNRGTTAQALTAEGRKKLQYTTDSPDSLTATWTDVDADDGAGIWRYNNCTAGTDDGAIPSAVLTAPSGGSNIVGDFIEGSGNITMTHNAGPAVAVENDYCLEANGVASNTTYYFRAYDNEQQTPVWREQDNDGANDCATAACTYPSLTTATVATVAVSGGCFTDESEGTPCSDDGANQIKVAVNGVVNSGVDTTVDGAWSFNLSSPPSSGAILTFFIDGEATESEEATTIVKYDGTGDVDGVKLYQSQLVIGTDSGSANTDQTITHADLDTTGNGYENSDDEDVIYGIASGVLTVDESANKTEQLYIMHGETFRPDSAGGDTTTTHHLEIDSTAVITADSNTFNVAGDWTNGGTFTAGSSTVNLNGTAADQTVVTNGQAFNALTLNNTATAGSDDVIISGALDVNGTFTITDGDLDVNTNDPNITTAAAVSIASAGTIDTGSGTWTFDGSGTSDLTDSAGTKQNLGAVTVDGTTKTLRLLSSAKMTSVTIGADDILNLNTSSYDLELTGTGTPLTINGTFTPGTSTVTYTHGTSATITPTVYSGLRTNGAGTYTLGGTVSDDFERASLGANWTSRVGTPGITGSSDFNGGSANENAATYSATTLGADQYAEATISAMSAGNEVQACVRATNSGNFDAYCLVTDGTFLDIYRIANAAWVANVATSATTAAVGDRIRIEAFGSDIRGYLNGRLILNGTDTNYTSGFAAAVVWASGTPTSTIEDFAAGTLVRTTADVTVTAGTLAAGNASMIVEGGDVAVSGTFTQSSNGVATVVSSGSIGGGTSTFGNIVVGSAASTQTTTAAGNFTASGVHIRQSSGTNEFSASSRTLTLSRFGTPLAIDSSETFTASTSTIVFTGSGATTIPLTTFNNLEVKPGTAGAVHTATGGGTLSVGGYLIVGNGSNTGTFNLDTNDPTLDVNGDLTISTSGTFVASSANNMTVGGSWSNSGTFTGATGRTVTFDSGSSGKTLAGTMTGSSAFYNVNFNNASGGWTFNANATFNENFQVSAGTVVQGTNRDLTMLGDFTLSSGSTFTKDAGSGLLKFDGGPGGKNLTDSTSPKQDLGNVVIGLSPGTTNLNSDLSATSVTIQTADRLNTKGYEVTTTGAFDCQGSCTLDMTDGGGGSEGDGTILDIGGDFTMSSSGTLTAATGKLFMNSTSGADTNRTLTTGGKAYADVELKNAGGTNDDITVSGNLDVNGVLTLTDGQIRLDTNDPNVTLAGNLSIASGATVTKADNGTATWTFDGTGTSTWTDSTAGVQDLGLVHINGTTKTINLASNAKATKLTIAASQNFGLGSSGYTFTLTGSGLTTSRPFQNSGTLNEGTNSTFAFTGTANTDIHQEVFHHLYLAPSGAGSPSYFFDPPESGTPTTIAGNLTIGDASNAVTADATGIKQVIVSGDLTISTNATFSYGSDSPVSVAGSFTNNGTHSDQGEGITFNGTATGKTISGSLTGSNKFLTLVFNGSGGEWTSSGTVEANQLAMQAGTWTGSGNVTLNVSGTGSAGVINRTGGTFEFRPTANGNFGPTTASTAWTFNDLTFGNAHASTPLTITTQNCSSCTVTVNGVLRVGKSGDAAGATTTLTGATTTWNLAGTSADPFILLSSPAGAFTANTSTVNYNGVNGSGNVNVANTNYSGLGCSPGSAEIYDVANSFTVSGTLTIGSNCTLTIASSQTLTHSGATLTLNGTINGAGRYTYQSSTALPATGTLSSILRMDATNNAQSITCSGGGRTLGGAVEFYNNSVTARTITVCGTASHILNISGAVTVDSPGSGGVTVEANTNDPAVNVTGNLTTGTSGGGAETVSLGAGTWTVTGNVDFQNSTITNYTGGTLTMNGTSGNSIIGNSQSIHHLIIDPSSAATINLTTSALSVLGDMTIATGDTFNLSTTLHFGSASVSTGTFTLNGTLSGSFMQYYSNNAFPTGGTMSAVLWMNCSATGNQTLSARTYGNAVQHVCSNAETTLYTAGTFNFSNLLQIAQNGSSGNLTIDAATNDPTVNVTSDLNFNGNSGQTGITVVNAGSGMWTVGGSVDFQDTGDLQNGQFNPETGGTLRMTADSINRTIETGGNTLYNFEVAASPRTVTLESTLTTSNNLTITSGTLDANNTENNALSVGGDFTNSATFTARAGTVTMTGSTKNIVGGNTSFYNLTINPTAASGTITATTSNFTVTNGLTVAAGDTFSLDTGRLISVTSAAEITWGDASSTISGAGILRFTNTSGGPGTGGTLSSVVRFDASSANIASTTIDARTYGGAVELSKVVAAARTVTPAVGTYTFGSLKLIGNQDAGAGNLAFVASTNNPTINVTGDVSGEDHGGVEDHTINMGSGTWTVSGNFNLTFITTLTHNSGTLAMNGSSKVLTANGKTLNNFQVTGGSVSVADTNVTIAGTVTLSSGTFTAPSGTLSVAGNWTNSGGSFAPNNGTVSFNGGGTQTVTTANTMTNVGCGGSAVAQTANKQFYNFVVAGGTVVLATNSDLGVDGNFQITSGSFDIRASDANYLYLKGNLDLDAVTGTAFNMREGTWTGGCGQVIMVGSNATQKIFVQAGQTYNVHSILFGDISATERTYYLSSSTASAATFRFQDYAIILSGTVDTKDGSQGTVNFNWNGTGQGQLYVGDDFGEHSATTKIFNANDATLSLGGIIVSDGQASNGKPSTFNAMTSTITTTGGTDGRIYVGNGAQPTRDDNTFDASTATTNAINLKAVYIDVGDIQATSNRAWTLTDPGASSTFTMSNNATFNAAGSTSTWLIAGGMDFGTGVTFTAGSTTFTQNGTGAAVIDADTDITFNNLTFDDTGSRTITLRDNDTSNRRIAVNGTFTWDQTVAANAANLTLGASTFTMTLALDNATVANSTISIPSGKTLTFANASTLELAGDFVNAGTLAESTGKVLLDGTNSSILNSGCATPAACTSQNFYNLEINKTGAGAGDDNVTLTSNGLNVANTLTITDGELVQGGFDARVEGSTAVSVASAGAWTNISTGDLTLGGTFTTAGTVTFNSNNGSQCVDGANDIVINSTVADTTRLWTNTGTLALYNVEADDMTDSSIVAYNSDLSDPQTTWSAGSCGITVSGTVYQSGNESAGYACNTNNLTLYVAVNGDVTPDTGTCTDAGGAFSISAVTDPGAADVPVAVYIDTGESVQATTVTLSSGAGANITGISLMIDRVLVSQQGGTATTNSHLNTADNGNAGIRYNVSAGALTVESGYELHILAGKTFTPGGAVTTTATGTAAGPAGDLHIAGTLTMGTNNLTVGGDYNNAGIFNKTNTQTTTLAAIGTGFTITPGTGALNNLTVSGSGGGNGTYTLSGADLTVDGTLTVDAGDTLSIDTSRTLTNTGSSNVNNDGTISGAGTLRFTDASGGPDSDANSTGAYSSIVRYDATNGNIASTTFDARTYGGKVELYSNSTSARTVTMASGTYTLSGASSHLNPIAANTADLTLDASTNNPTVSVGGDLDFTGTGSGFEVIAAGTGTWTVTGNVDFTNGTYGPLVTALTPTLQDTAQRHRFTDSSIGCALSTNYSCTTTGTYGLTEDTDTCIDSFEDRNEYAENSWMKYNPTGLSDSTTVLGAGLGVNVLTTYSFAILIGRSSTDDLTCSNPQTAYSATTGSQYGTTFLSSTGNKFIPLGPTGASDLQFRLTGTTARLTVSLSSASLDAAMGSVTFSARPVLYVSHYDSGSPTLTMNGSAKTLTAAGNTLYNLNVSGTVTLANETLYVAGDLNLTGGDVTPGTSTVAMLGAGKTLTAPAAGDTLYAVTIDPQTAGTVTFASGGGDLTVTNALSVASGDTLSLGSGRTLSHTFATNTALSGTISGSGTIRYPNGAGGPGATGTLSASVRYDASAGNVAAGTVDARTYGGPVEFYDNSGSARTITSPAGTFTYSGSVSLTEAGAGSLLLELNTSDPSSTINGALTIGANTTLSANSANALNINSHYTNNGTFTDNGGTVTLAGTAQQNISGTTAGSSDFNNLTITNSFGDGSSTWSVTFAGDLTTANTFTAATANTKLRFNAGSTYTFDDINFSGTAGNLVLLRSSSAGSVWFINAGAGSRTVTYAAVKDSNACGSTGGLIDASIGTNRDDGNTPCWLINKIEVSLSANTLNLGTLSASQVNQAFVTSTVTTNAGTGYVSLVRYNQTLTSGVNTIADSAGGSIGNGDDEFGASTDESNSVDLAVSSNACVTGSGPMNATALSTSFKSFALSSAAATNRATKLCLVASAPGTKQAGVYQNTLTIVTTSRF